MNKEDIKEYVEKLKNFEKKITGNDNTVTEAVNFMGELDGLLSNLNDDILKMQKTPPIKVKFKKLHPNAVTPKYSKEGDAGMDLTATSKEKVANGIVIYKTGIAIEIPWGYVGLIFPRSSISNFQLTLTNCVGVIDSGYRGEIMGKFRNTDWTNEDNSTYDIGDRIMQIIIIPYPEIEFIESETLSETERGEGGFGHSGK